MPAAPRHDVAVIGAGIAGLMACVLLRRAGLSVVCLDVQTYPHAKVGESLDWSGAALLGRAGIDRDRLLADDIATWKKHIVVYERDRQPWQATPPPFIRRAPLRFETVTLPVDRMAVDARLHEQARALGTEFVWDRVNAVACVSDRVTGCRTAGGRHIDARWYLDATGSARLFSREMAIPIVSYGRQKVCLWTYFETPPLHEGTAFFVDNGDAYLRWVWDIPISSRQTSVGLVVAADAVRDQRRAGSATRTILHEQLARHPRFDALLERQPDFAVRTTSFQPYVTTRVCGSNWLIIGEAASMPDPLTGNGFTSGLRHARHAADAILDARAGELAERRRRTYTRHVARLGHAFNAHIENTVYDHPVRWAFGLQTATYVYTFFAFFMNALHARFDPRGPAGMAVFRAIFAAATAWIGGWNVAARAVLWGRGLRSGRDG